jgi:S1-C subfamily serine protease
MKKRIISLLLTVAALSAAGAAHAAPVSAAGSLKNFTVKQVYTSGQFQDVSPASWYAMYVQAGYEYGLLGGRQAGQFAPSAHLTVAEAVKLAVSLHSVYHTGKAAFASAAPWYKPYVDEALKKQIIPAPYDDYNRPVSRAEFAEMLSRALPDGALPAINTIYDNAVPDVAMSDSFSGAVYRLYRAGVLRGSDRFGTFRPFDPLSRAEAAAIVARAADTGFRERLTLPSVLNGEGIYAKCADAVFYLERYDTEGDLVGIGSGFFITRDGLAVTNYHVIEGAASAVITSADGQKYDVVGVCGYDKVTDLALLQIGGKGFSYLPLADSDKLEIGETVYAIGSPLGLVNSFSSGIISSTARQLNGSTFLQYSAHISTGSGGGPVVNRYGQVVGVTCLTIRNGQTMNFAVPSNFIGDITRTDCIPLLSLVSKDSGKVYFYKNYFPVPDYGAFTGTPLYKTTYDEPTNVKTFYYKQVNIIVSEDVAVGGYVAELKKYGFAWQSSYTNAAGYTVDVYYSEAFDTSVHFGLDSLDGFVCRFVAIH